MSAVIFFFCVCVQTVNINISSSRALHTNDDGGGVVDPKLLFIYLSDTDPAAVKIQDSTRFVLEAQDRLSFV